MATVFNKDFSNISYLPADRTPYTATDTQSQLLAIYKPLGKPEDYGFAGGFPYCLYYLNATFNSSGPASAVNAIQSPLTTVSGYLWQLPMRGIALVVATGTAAVGGSAVTGKGFFHAFGGVDRRGETYANAFTDALMAAQYMQLHAVDYGLNPDAWFPHGDSSGGHIAGMIGLAPNWAGVLGTGGQYDMNTVPNACFIGRIAVVDWNSYINTQGGGGPPEHWHPKAETGANAEVEAGDLNLAVARYLDESRVWSFVQKGTPRNEVIPPTFWHCATVNMPTRFCEPFQTGVITAANIHSSWNGLVMREHFKGRLQLYLSTTAAASTGAAGKYDGIIDDLNAQGVAGSFLETDAANIFINWACRAVKTPKWNVGRFPRSGIFRRGQVETVGAVRVPANPWRGGVLIDNTGSVNDLLAGPDQASALRPISPTSTGTRGPLFIRGTDPVWLKSAAGVTSFTAREISRSEAAAYVG